MGSPGGQASEVARLEADLDPLPDSGVDGAGPAAGTPDVLAAGVLCWRVGPHGVEVLLVHRPTGDWSFPKGRLEDGELLPQCAIRELAEETGATPVLGRPLPAVSHRDQNGTLERVSYWAGRVVAQDRPSASPQEIDRVEWLPLSRARDRLAGDPDAAPLNALAAMATAGELDTTPILVVRHGTARPRDAWARADADRPLIASGRRQAWALADLLECWRPEHVVSSPWRRCVDTMTPYAAKDRVKIRTKGGLSERGFRRDPHKARKHLMTLLGRNRPAALCTHRPVLAGVFRALRERTPGHLVSQIPSQDPFLAPGEVLVAHMVHPPGRPAHVVDLERHLVPR